MPTPTRDDARTPGAKIAIARVTRRSRERRRGGVLGLVLTSSCCRGGGDGCHHQDVEGAGLIASLDRDPPDVKQFES